MKYQDTFGVSGRLVDEASGKPVGDVPITVTINEHRFKKVSSQNGCFDVNPRYKLRLWIAGCPALIPPVVEVLTEGYEPFKARGSFFRPLENGVYLVENDYLRLGDVRLKRKQSTPSPDKGP
jgi:hypothetical protein